MKFKLFEQVALARNIPEKQLQRGDVATIVDSHPANGGDEILHVRLLTESGAIRS